VRSNPSKFIILLLIFFLHSTVDKTIKYSLIVFKFLHIKSNYGIVIQFEFIIIVIIILYFTNLLEKNDNLLLAKLLLMHLSSL